MDVTLYKFVFYNFQSSMYRHFFKRFLDFWISLIALICLSPLLLIIGIWLYVANSPTPAPPRREGEGSIREASGKKSLPYGGRFRRGWSRVFFFQERPGKNAKIFKVIKFKTMTDERDAEGKMLPDAQRLTKVGRFVRSTSIDELPQLINVLKGEMSLIGPRPLMPKYLSLYSKEQARRHEVRPGISGWAQCHGRNAISWTEKFKLDVWYVDHCTLWTDLKVIFITIKKVIGREDIAKEGMVSTEPFNGNN